MKSAYSDVYDKLPDQGYISLPKLAESEIVFEIVKWAYSDVCLTNNVKTRQIMERLSPKVANGWRFVGHNWAHVHL